MKNLASEIQLQLSPTIGDSFKEMYRRGFEDGYKNAITSLDRFVSVRPCMDSEQLIQILRGGMQDIEIIVDE